MNIVTIYDIQNKFIAFIASFPEVIDVVYEWGAIFVLAGDKKVSLHFSYLNFKNIFLSYFFKVHLIF